MNKAKFIKEVEVPDPESNMMVDISIFKHENGGIFGIDSSYITQLFDDDELIVIPDPLSDTDSMDYIALMGI